MRKGLARSMTPSPSVSSRMAMTSWPRGPLGGGSGRRSYFVRKIFVDGDGLEPLGIRILNVLQAARAGPGRRS